jgi:hypothetical protein
LTTYGYRLFAVELYEGAKRQAQKFGAAEFESAETTTAKTKVHYFAHIQTDISAKLREAYETNTVTGETGDDTSAIDGVGAALRFTSVARDGNVLKLKFEHGLRNRDGTLRLANGDDQPLENLYTLYPYRAVMVCSDDWTKALVAVETRGHSCPADYLTAALKRSSSVPWRLKMLTHLAGEAAMVAFLQSADISRVTFDKYEFSDDGSRKPRKDVSLAILPLAEANAIRASVESWMRSYFGFEKDQQNGNDEVDKPKKMTRAERKQFDAGRRAEKTRRRVARQEQRRSKSAEAATALKEDIFANRTDEVEIDFDDVRVEMSDGSNTRTFRPSSDFRRLTYPLGKSVVSDEKFNSEAVKTASDLLEPIQGMRFDVG